MSSLPCTGNLQIIIIHFLYIKPGCNEGIHLTDTSTSVNYVYVDSFLNCFHFRNKKTDKLHRRGTVFDGKKICFCTLERIHKEVKK
jgi:hypothetical protein